MCGLTGFIAAGSRQSHDELISRVTAMTDTLHHRGPDQGGAWADAETGLAIGARRLSVIELSASADQPMTSGNGRWVIAYNGEVYNFQDLRQDLIAKGHEFRGHGDTEVVAEAIAEWGVEDAARRFNGMFALAAWDRQQRRLYLVRDRLGVKPLYWGHINGALFFGSELKALRAYPDWTAEIDPQAVAAYFRFAYVPAPGTIYKGVQKLLPGHILSFSPGSEPSIAPFWSLHDAALSALADPFTESESTLVENLDELLRDAIGIRKVADVPVGSFLSGGIDSSLVTAILSDVSSSPVNTFTIGFADAAYDEAPHAEAVARHLGTDHTALMIEPDQIAEIVPELSQFYDEPFADSSQIPMALVSRLAKEKVTVALSGDGGDELFGGYERYHWGDSLWRRIEGVPKPLRQGAGHLAQALDEGTWDSILSLLPPRLRPGHGGQSIHWLANAAATRDFGALYQHLVSIWEEPPVDYRGDGLLQNYGSEKSLSAFRDPVDRMQYADTMAYLPDDILTKLDRASMAFSLEAREPLLDPRLLEFSWRLPRQLKTKEGQGKVILRKLLEKYVPKEIIERPKQGFSVPIGDWLRGPLREWAETLLSDDSLRNDDILDVGVIRTCWQSHLNGSQDNGNQLWTVLMFLAWRNRWRS